MLDFAAGCGPQALPPPADLDGLDDPHRVAEALTSTSRALGGRLPRPGTGSTWPRWCLLAEATRRDVALGRMLEAHTDALAIIAELGGLSAAPQPEPGQTWGVWAADPPSARPRATPAADVGWRLTGPKAWCSGAGILSHALVTAHAADGYRLLAVDLAAGRRAGTVRTVPGSWASPALTGADTLAVHFQDAAAVAVGGPGDYLDRPGFWQGSVGVAACWFGGALGVADALAEADRRRPLDAHALAHVGAVHADLTACAATLRRCAEEVDADPSDRQGQGLARALVARSVVEAAATRTLERVGRALGPGPLAQDRRHARRVGDLTVYLRQSHAERDLATLGRAALDRAALDRASLDTAPDTAPDLNEHRG